MSRKKKPGQKGTSPRKALAQISRFPAIKPAVRRRTALETMHQMGHITDRMLWAGERFARGWAVASGGSSAAAGRDFDPWAPKGGIAIPEQLRAVQAMDGIASDYQAACEAMDRADTRPADPHGAPRRATARGTIRRIVIAVACEERSCGEIDRQAGKAPPWASRLLKEGLRIYVEMFGASFKREVPGYLRGVG